MIAGAGKAGLSVSTAKVDEKSKQPLITTVVTRNASRNTSKLEADKLEHYGFSQKTEI